MSYQINLEEVDSDGAIREAADAVSGDSRLDFLRKAGLAGGAVFGGGAVLTALTAPAAFAASSGRPPSKFGKGDIGILNYALTLEYLEAAFYAQAVAGGALTDSHLAALAGKIAGDEKAHVAFLKAALGSKAVPMPKFNFMGTTTNQAKFAATAQILENTGVGAYFGQGFNIKSPAVLKDAISILTVEARHAGAIGFYNDATAKAVSPSGAFDKPLTASKVLAAVAGTGFIA
ncbi:MAG TPA: ferritin-like domain-containing protein [Solirubrobacteraceae bacterium]